MGLKYSLITTKRFYLQVISSSNDRMILVWSPAMDEVLPDGLSDVVHKLQLDDWSDDD